MFDYPKWKYWIIAAVVLLAALFALPNVFQSIPAVQITAAKKGLVVDASVKGIVEAVLIGKAGEKIPTLGVEFEGDRVIARFSDVEAQL